MFLIVLWWKRFKILNLSIHISYRSALIHLSSKIVHGWGLGIVIGTDAILPMIIVCKRQPKL